MMKDWNNLTIGEYQEIVSIISNENIDKLMERDVKLLALVTGKDEDYFNDLSLIEFAYEKVALNFFNDPEIPGGVNEFITVGENKYKVCLDAFRGLTAGQYIDLMHLTKEENYLNVSLHTIMACLCLPVRDDKVEKYGETFHSDIAADLLNARFIDCYNTAGFFLKVWNGCMAGMPDYLAELIDQEKILKKKEAQEMLTRFLNVGDGLQISKQSASS